MNIRENVNTEPTKLLGIAAILQSLPKPVVWLGVGVSTALIGYSVFYWLAWINLALDIAFWLCIASFVLYTSSRLHKMYYEVLERGERYRLLKEKTNQEAWKTISYKNKAQLPAYIVESGLATSKNVEYGGAKAFDYRSNIHTIQAGESRLTQIEGPDFIPEPFKFSELIGSGWRPTKDGILLAKKDDLLLCPIGEGLCHTTFTGSTDSGKTSDSRLLLSQLLYLGQVVFILDKNYQAQRLDKKSGVIYDYRPIERLLSHKAINNSAEALNFLTFVLWELERRRALRRDEPVEFDDWYVFVDELPAFCSDEKEFISHIGRIVREARQYGIFFIGAAQDVLVNTLGGDNGAIRKNFLTNFYGGGDFTTAKMMLGLEQGEQLNEQGLGKMGLKYIRAKGADIERVRARVPLSDNLATLMLLSDLPPVAQIDVPNTVESSSSGTPDDALLDAAYDVCAEIQETGKTPSASKVSALLSARGRRVGKTKAAELLNILEAQGTVVR